MFIHFVLNRESFHPSEKLPEELAEFPQNLKVLSKNTPRPLDTMWTTAKTGLQLPVFVPPQNSSSRVRRSLPAVRPGRNIIQTSLAETSFPQVLWPPIHMNLLPLTCST